MHIALFSLFIHLPCLGYTHNPYYLTLRWGQLCSHVPSVLPLSSTPFQPPQNPPINITEDGCVFIVEIDCGYRVMVPFMCVCVSVRLGALWEAALWAEMWGRQAFLPFPEPSSRSLSVRSLILCSVEGLLPPFLPLSLSFWLWNCL